MKDLLIFLVVVFLSVIIGYFIWGVGYIVQEVDKSNTANAGSGNAPGFNLSDAATLNYRGTLLAAQVTATTATTTTAAASTTVTSSTSPQ